jgi:hypothetical protein
MVKVDEVKLERVKCGRKSGNISTNKGTPPFDLRCDCKP